MQSIKISDLLWLLLEHPGEKHGRGLRVLVATDGPQL
jgi:hypothetical protein